MKNYNKTVLLFVIVLVFVCFYFFTKTKNSGNNKTLVIGASLAFSGSASSWGEVEKNGIELALADFRKNNPKENISVVYEDSKSTSVGGIASVKKLISIDKAQYIVGPTWLDSTVGAQSLLDQYPNVKMVTPSATIVGIQQPKKYENLYSLYNDLDKEAKNIIDIMNHKKAKSLVVLSLQDSYFEMIIDSLNKQSKESEIKILKEEYVQYGSDPKTAVEKLSTYGADAILVASFDPQISISAYKTIQQKFDKKVLKIGTNIDEFLSTDSDNMGLIESVYYFKPKSTSSEFIERYKSFYSVEPKFSASQAYDTMNFILEVLEKKKNPETTIQNTASYGEITMSKAHGIKTDNQLYSLYKIENSKEILIK